jgi:hypothetical protein
MFLPCPQCKTKFVIKPIEPPLTVRLASDEYTTRCPYCGKVMTVSAANEKMVAKCIGCMAVFTPYRYTPPSEIKQVHVTGIDVPFMTLIGIGFILALGMAIAAIPISIVFAILF